MTVTYRDVVDAWDRADPSAIHPSREVSEADYWDSGRRQAAQLATALRDAGLAGGIVLDYGCGDGRVAIPLAAAGWRVIGTDTSPRMLARLEANAHGTVETAQVDALPVVDASYCLAVLIHHDRAGAERIVRTIRDAVRLGGLLVLDWPVSDEPHVRRDWIDVTTWDPASRDELAARLGLELVPSGLPWVMYRRVG